MSRYERRHPKDLPMFDKYEDALILAANYYGGAASHHVAQYVGYNEKGEPCTSRGIKLNPHHRRQR